MKNKKNPLLETIRISRDEWNDYENMKNFIFENDLGVKFMIFEDVVNQMKQATLLENDKNATEMKKLN
tara:strand:+ start:99 stop:302 length:204 start_codon:yes stop_codon:yes gene_type:complete